MSDHPDAARAGDREAPAIAHLGHSRLDTGRALRTGMPEAVFADGKKVAPARISVTQNGVTIHKDVPIPIDNTTAGMGGDPSKPGPIMLQDHGNPVQYRNIWLQKLD